MFLSIPECICIYIIFGLCTWMFFNVSFFTQENMNKFIEISKNKTGSEIYESPDLIYKLSAILASSCISVFVLSVSLIFWPVLLPIFVFLKEFKMFSKISF